MASLGCDEAAESRSGARLKLKGVVGCPGFEPGASRSQNMPAGVWHSSRGDARCRFKFRWRRARDAEAHCEAPLIVEAVTSLVTSRGQ